MTYIPNAADASSPILAQPDAVDFDNLLLGISGDGVISGCNVSANSPPDLAVDVASGMVRINGAVIVVAASPNLAISTGNVTNPRCDLITVDTSGVVAVVTGTPATVPVLPVIPSDKVAVALVLMVAGAVTVAANRIIDKRVIQLSGTLAQYQPTLNSVVLHLESESSSPVGNPKEDILQGSLATIDATQSTLISYTLVSDATTIIRATVTATRTGGSAGSAGDGAGYVRVAAFKNPAGTAALIGSVGAVFTAESDAACDCTLDASGATARVRVTGIVDVNYTWAATLEIFTIPTS